MTRSRHDLTDEQKAEQRLVAEAQRGNRAAFREIVERYEGLVAATVIGMLGPGPEADDVGQCTFIRFYEALDQYRGEGGLAPYLSRIAVNLSLNALERRKRSRQRFVSRDSDDDAPGGLRDTGTDGADTLERVDRQQLVRSAINELSADHKAVVVLRMLQGYSTKEAAVMLDVPVGTVLSRLYRAQARLRELLAPYLENEYEG